MEILKDQGRQYSLWASANIGFADGLTVAQAIGTGIQDLLDLPAGAEVVGGSITVTEVWDQGTTAVLDIGDVDDPDRYTSSPVDLKSLGRTALTLDGKVTTGEETVDVDPVLVGADSTQGAATIRVEYVINDRAHENQGLNVADYGSKNAPETG
jgi:hypothetical protein